MQPEVEPPAASDNSLYACPFPSCKRTFRTRFSCNRHSVIHTEQKQHICQYCDKKFALPQYLKEHINTHTQEAPYVCGVAGCQMRFKQSGKLSLHRRTHSEYNVRSHSKHGERNKERNKCERSHEQDRTAVCVQAAKRDELEEKCGSEEQKQALLRQDSGMTTASNSEEWVVSKVSKTTNSQLTKEALDRLNEKEESGDNLKAYLACLMTPMASFLRPVLPVPDQIKIRHEKVKRFPFDLFELTRQQL